MELNTDTEAELLRSKISMVSFEPDSQVESPDKQP